MKVLAILLNNENKTIGARIEKDGKILDISTYDLKNSIFKFENAILDKKGYVRGVNTKLPKLKLNTKPNTKEQHEMISANKLLKNNTIKIYHGSKEPNLTPTFGQGKPNNDYGKGFYTTPNKELAKEWAWGTYSKGNRAYIYSYILDINNLKILDLTKLDSLHWIAELLFNRRINKGLREVDIDNMKKFIYKYKLDTKNYDIIIGYRADDSYFAYAEAFVTGGIYRETLDYALRTGELGIQIFIKSKRAFNIIKQTDKQEVNEKYKNYFLQRDKNARTMYQQLKHEQQFINNKHTIYDFI